jgi:hypothetical protein
MTTEMSNKPRGERHLAQRTVLARATKHTFTQLGFATECVADIDIRLNIGKTGRQIQRRDLGA